MTVKSSTPVASPVQLFKRDGPTPTDLVPVEAAEDYEIVGASATDQALGATGAVGDFLARVIITASTGTITIKDGAGTIIVIPAAALGVWEIGAKSIVGAWNVTTPVTTSCVCIGQFT